MSKCSVCGAELFESSKFCPECGTPISEAVENTSKEDEKGEAKAAEDKSEKAEKSEVKAAPANGRPDVNDNPDSNTAESGGNSAEEKKKSPVGIIAAVAAVAAIIIIAGLVAGGGSEGPSQQTTLTLRTTAATTEAAAADTTTEAATATELTATSAVPETTAVTTTTTVTTTAATTPLLTENVVIEPEHVSAMGKAISCSFALSDYDISMDMLGDDMKIVAEYTGQSASMSQNPVMMIVTVGETEAEFIPDETSEVSVTFYVSSVRRNLVDIMGFTDEDINELAFRSNGAPVDVERITIEAE